MKGAVPAPEEALPQVPSEGRAQPLLRFFTDIRRDPRIGPSHIALYAALYRRWLEQAGTDPVRGYSHELMPTAKLCSSGTYHRVLRELHAYGYLYYVPSFNRLRPSQIFLQPECQDRT